MPTMQQNAEKKQKTVVIVLFHFLKGTTPAPVLPPLEGAFTQLKHFFSFMLLCA